MVINDTLINDLVKILDSDRVLTEAALKDRYVHIWKMHIPLNARVVVLPKTTEEVSQIMRICFEANQAVIVHGGLTNLVGSTETQGNEVVIAMEKMTGIEEVDVESRTMTVQAGVILENIQNAAKENDLLFPLNFGAKGTAQIGGIISTNAGGLRVFRFGMTRNLVLGLEAVLPDGTIISSLKKIIKDNSAYDLKQLFIGSEGTLGIITRAVVKLVETPKSRNSAFVGFNDYKKVIAFLKYMDGGLAGTLSGFELIWKRTYGIMTTPPALPNPPLPQDYNYYVLLESLGSHPENDKNRLQELLEEALEKDFILDAVMADTASDLEWFWKIREDVKVLDAQSKSSQHFDISLPIPQIGEMIQQIEKQLYEIPAVGLVCVFGHVADGNIHLIVGKDTASQEIINQVNDVVYGPLKALGGSVSAEHGIGLHKKAYLSMCRTTQEIELMKTLKRTLDTKGILNPGKVIDV